MREYLLDSNILMYFSQGNEQIKKSLENLNREYFFISSLSYVELLMGTKNKKEFQMLDDLLHQFAPLDIGIKIAKELVRLEKKYPKKLKFKDLLIAATAQVEGLTLVTADKDFTKIKELEVKLLKL